MAAWHRSGVFIVNFEHISHLALVFLLLTLNMQLPAGKSPLATIGLIDYKTSFGEKPIKTLKTEILDGIL